MRKGTRPRKSAASELRIYGAARACCWIRRQLRRGQEASDPLGG